MKARKERKKYIRIFMLVRKDSCKRQNVFWLMVRFLICLLNFHHHLAKSHLLKITLKFCFLAWVLRNTMAVKEKLSETCTHHL